MARILVICGGDNAERRVSLSGGDAVARGLANSGHEAWKLDTAAPGQIVPHDQPLLDGPVGVTPPGESERARLNREGWLQLFDTISDPRWDAVFPLLHGTWGEGGQIQSVLELVGKPYLGSDSRASALALDKWRSHQIAELIEMPVARGRLLRPIRGNTDSIEEAVRTAVAATLDSDWGRFSSIHPHPVVLKPNTGGSTVGITISSNEQALHNGTHLILDMPDLPYLEEFVPGREVTVPVIGGEATPMVEIRPREGYYDYTNKYTKGKTDYLCPAPVPDPVQVEAAKLAVQICEELDCRHVARVDFRLTEDNRLIFLEVNTIPGMTDLSLVPMSAKQIGLDFPALMNRFVELVLG